MLFGCLRISFLQRDVGDVFLCDNSVVLLLKIGSPTGFVVYIGCLDLFSLHYSMLPSCDRSGDSIYSIV